MLGVRTSSTSGSTATGLKKWMPTSAPISSTERLEVLVASTQSGSRVLAQLGEDLLLDLELLEDRLEHEVAVGEVVVGRRGRDERGEKARLALVVAALGDLLGEAFLDRRAGLRQERPRSRSRIATGTSSRRRKSVASCAAIRPAPTSPTLRIGRGAAAGRPGALLARRSTRSKA